MPRGVKKTHSERLKEIRADKKWRDSQPPLRSPCILGRRRHNFPYPGTTRDKCSYCGKSREQIKREKKGA